MSNRSFLTLRVEGMTCESCARPVTQALKAVPGVEDAQVGAWRVGLATVVAGPVVTDRVSPSTRRLPSCDAGPRLR